MFHWASITSVILVIIFASLVVSHIPALPFLKSILRFTILCLPMLTQAVMDSLRKAPIPGDRFPQTFHTIFSKSMHFLCLKYPYTIIHELTPKLMPYFFCGWDTGRAHTLDGRDVVCNVCFCNTDAGWSGLARSRCSRSSQRCWMRLRSGLALVLCAACKFKLDRYLWQDCRSRLALMINPAIEVVVQPVKENRVNCFRLHVNP